MYTSEITYHQKLEKYYGWHANFYDATRWAFLFGRDELIHSLPDLPRNASILEVGCGTGFNLSKLRSRYPMAEITGLDLSSHMLNVAANRRSKAIRLVNQSYEKFRHQSHNFDLILLSYSLTMMNRSPQKIITELKRDLSSQGIIAVVDFHRTPYSWFHDWMRKNHAHIDGSFLPFLQHHFNSIVSSKQDAYGGLWSYFRFTGHKSEIENNH